MKKLKVNNNPKPKMHADIRGLHLSTPTSKVGSASVSVTGRGPQVSAGNKNFSATVNKQVKSLAANAGKDRRNVDSNKNIKGTPILNIETSKSGIAKSTAGIKPIKVLNIAVKVKAAIISLNLMGAINKFVKFLLQISSKNIML